MNKYLIKLANHLDKKGLHKEADYVDWIMKRANPMMSLMEQPEASGYDTNLQSLSDKAEEDNKTVPLNSLNNAYTRIQFVYNINKEAIKQLKAMKEREGNEVYYTEELGATLSGVNRFVLSDGRLRPLPNSSMLENELSRQSDAIKIDEVIKIIENYQMYMQEKTIPKLSLLLGRRKPEGPMNENISRMYDAGFSPLK